MPRPLALLLPAATGLLLALTPLASQAADPPAPLLRTAMEQPARLQPAYYYRGAYYPYRHGGHYWRYRYGGHYCNHRVRRHGYWYCR